MKAKGLIVKDFPKHWTNWQNPNKPNDKFTKEEIEFNNKLLIEKRPYFMKYLYPTYKAQYKAHLDKYNYLCIRTFGIDIKELMKLENKTEEQQKLIDNYIKFNPFLDTSCPMNDVCHFMEKEVKEIKINVKKQNPDYIFDILFNKKIEITNEEIKEMEKVYKTYRKDKSSENSFALYDEEGNLVKNTKEDMFDLNLDYISTDIQKLANLAVYVNYYLYPKSSKNFCWDLFGQGIILNIYDNSNKEFYLPLRNRNGNIEYMGKNYINERVEIDFDNI